MIGTPAPSRPGGDGAGVSEDSRMIGPPAAYRPAGVPIVTAVQAMFWPRLPRRFPADRPPSTAKRFPVRAVLTPRLMIAALAVGAALMAPATSHAAVACGTSTFEAWLADFKTDAAAKGISQAAIASGLNGVTQDKGVLARDHSQAVFNQSFEEFSGRMVPPRLLRGSNMLKQYGSVLVRIEQAYGVPAEVIVAIGGLETDFGVNNGKFPTIRSLATLAYDCRRSDG